jgi:L-alanine-DL-glutamate epimerase-like enolase superfamily enzyme
MAMEYGVPMAMHYAGLPIGAFASVHCAAATENFLACENHSLDVPQWIVFGVWRRPEEPQRWAERAVLATLLPRIVLV